MTLVTVGVPVYNGAGQLRESLECLLSQSYKDISIRIYDNASTDATPDIAREFEIRDSRIRLMRHPQNIKAMPNFHRVILDCNTPYLMWRAHDDLSSPDYVEHLLRSLRANPNANLAIPTINTIWPNGVSSIHPPWRSALGSSLADIRSLLLDSHPAWFYGLWKRDALLPVFECALASFPVAWAFDHLVLFPFLLDRVVVMESEAIFIQRMVQKSYTPKKVEQVSIDTFVNIHRKFYKQCLKFIDNSQLNFIQRAYVRILLQKYTDIKVYKIKKIVNGRIFRNEIPASIINSEF